LHGILWVVMGIKALPASEILLYEKDRIPPSEIAEGF
jgi:hypothetical protein